MNLGLPTAAPRVALAVVMATTLAGSASWAQEGADAPLDTGVWRNPKGSVHIELKPCGEQICGYVVWASAKAQADARRAGTPDLIGKQLLRDFAPSTGKVYRGKVFAPDLNATFTGTAQRIDARSLRAKGCLVAGLLCKSQVWTRIDAAPADLARAG